MLGLRHPGARPRAGSVSNMYPARSSCTAAEGASICFLALWCCSDVTQIVVTRPANSNRLLVSLYMLFESVRFFWVGCFPLTMQLCGSAHGCSPHWIHALHIRRLASGESIFMGNVVTTVCQTVVTKPANTNCTLVTLHVLFESLRFFESGCFPHCAFGTGYFPSRCICKHC
jgi:hypothetical protein